jgi:hypothetical protein
MAESAGRHTAGRSLPQLRGGPFEPQGESASTVGHGLLLTNVSENHDVLIARES